jgi:DNA-binding MarR family transcriptional regulator
MAKASARLQVHPTSVTNAVDRLEAADLVRRVAHPSDGRTTLVEITPAGLVIVLDATARLNSLVFSRPGIAQSDVENLVTVLAGFRRDAGDFAEPGPARA